MMRRRLTPLLARFAAALALVLTTLSSVACQSTDYEEMYMETHEALLIASEERDAAILREEELRQQILAAQAEVDRARASAGRGDPNAAARLADAQRQLTDYQRQLGDAQAMLEEARGRMGSAEAAAQQAAVAARQHQQEAVRLQQQLADMQNRVTSAQDQNSVLQDEVARLKASGKDAYLTKDGNIEIRLSSDVTFASGEATLTRKGMQSLRGLSALLQGEYAPYRVRVEGHTDATPLKRTKDKWGDNFGLGSARALSVVRFMESDMGIASQRLESASRGMHDPVVASARTKTELAKNRRVSVVVVMPRQVVLDGRASAR